MKYYIKTILFIFLITGISIEASTIELNDPSWKTNYERPEFFEGSGKNNSRKFMAIDPHSDEVSGYLIELHNERKVSKLDEVATAFLEYSQDRSIPVSRLLEGTSSHVFYLKNDKKLNNTYFYDLFGKVVTWFQLNRGECIVSIRPILKDQSSHLFDPEMVIWMESIVARKGQTGFRNPEETVVDGFHIHVDYLEGQEKQASLLKDSYRLSASQNGIIYSALDSYSEKVNGPHVRAGWEVKFEKAGATVFDRFGYSLAWLLLNHQDIPVYSHPKTWIYGENEERLISHLDSGLYIGTPPDLNQWFFFNPEVNLSGLYRWDSHLPHARKISTEESLAKQNQILKFWFGDDQSDYPVVESKLWFSKQNKAYAEFDKYILDTYQKDLVLATIGAYKSWERTPKGRLALILLLDQFPRNMFRGSPMAFAYDKLALTIAKAGIDKGDDQKLNFAERLFFYLPFAHSENLDDQKQSVDLQNKLKNDVPEKLRDIFTEHFRMAQLHKITVEKFSRLSSRNTILERVSTSEELEFLKNPDHNF